MKKGFTLAEVLITLVVLGVLALILIPNFAKLMPNENIIKYQKAFYTLQDAVNDMVNDEDTCQTDESASFDNPLKYCSDGTTTRTLSQEVCERLSTVQGASCTATSSCVVVKTTNGMQWAIPETSLNTDFSSAKVKVRLSDASTNITCYKDGNTEDTTNGIYLIDVNSSGKVTPTEAGAALLKKNPTDN